MYRSSNRFDNYGTITARFDSIGSCGHPITKGETIGYNPRAKKAVCPDCWRRWQAENEAAEADERFYASQY